MPGTKCEFNSRRCNVPCPDGRVSMLPPGPHFTYVWCAIVSLVWIPFALTLCICKTHCVRMAKTLLVQKADAVARVVRTTFALTLCVQKGNALTVFVRKADAMARVVRTAFTLTLCVRKTFALTFCVCKTRAAFRRQMPWHLSSGRHLP